MREQSIADYYGHENEGDNPLSLIERVFQLFRSGVNTVAGKPDKYIRSMNKRLKRDDHREERIDMEIIVDAYDEEERAMGWYYYLADMIEFPFDAACIATQHTSPLEEEDVVRVIGMAPEVECLREMFVNVEWNDREIAVPLAQLRGISVGEDTQEAIEDWHYWVGRGYGF